MLTANIEKTIGLYVFFTDSTRLAHSIFIGIGAMLDCETRIFGGPGMADILTLVFGTGGIVLMAAYAALCERI